MKTFRHSWLLVFSLALAACSDDDADATPNPGTGTDTADAGDDENNSPDDAGTEEDGEADSAPDGDSDPGTCSNTVIATCEERRNELLNPVDAVSTGEVKVLSTEGSTLSVYVDASAGGTVQAASNPYVYIKLGTGERVDITDLEAASSSDWDLAIKRTVFATNSGHWGPGAGGALFFEGKAFDEVTATDAATANIPQETLFDDTCNAILDGRGSPVTTMGDWYQYDMETHAVLPKDGTYVVRGADCTLYKLRIESNIATPEGDTNPAISARYLLLVAPL